MTLAFLIATLAALAAGPLLYAAARENARTMAFLDGFVLVSIVGLVLLEVVPGTFMEGGGWSIVFLLAGLFGPTLLERSFHRAEREAHIAALALAMCGLVLHTLADGTVLAPNAGTHWALPLAVVLHSIPVGMAVWWLLAPHFGRWPPVLAIAAMVVGTVVGYRFGAPISDLLGAQAWAWFQSLVAGTILHVIFGRPHLHGPEDPHHEHAEPRMPPHVVRYEAYGNLLALGALVLISLIHASAAAAQSAMIDRFMALALESAPALLLAYVIGGFIYGELPEPVLRWLSAGGRVSQALRGTALGLPLPICSCSVLPLYQSLVMRGAAPASALAFLIAAPEIGLTALFVSLPLLGLEMTLLRVGSAAVLAAFVGYAVSRWARAVAPAVRITGPAHEHDCCHHGDAPTASSAAAAGTAAVVPRWRRALRAGFVDLVDGTAPWIVLGLVIAALAEPMLMQVMWARWPDALEVIAFALVGMPLYVCAAGATPLIAVLLAAGVSPGAAIAFLLTGPATNIATFGLLRALHGSHLAWLFAIVTAAAAVLMGLAVNALPLPPPVTPSAEHAHATPIEIGSLALLALLYGASLLRRGARAFIAELADTGRRPATA